MAHRAVAQVLFQPSGRRGPVPLGVSLAEAAHRLGESLESPCGGSHRCGKCRVRIEEGPFDRQGLCQGLQSQMAHAGPWQPVEQEHLSEAERRAGFRLACATSVTGDLLVSVPESTRAAKQVVSKAARPLEIELNPAVKRYQVSVPAPDLTDPTADFERLAAALANRFGLTDLTLDGLTLRTLPWALRTGHGTVTVSIWMEREIIRVQPGAGSRSLGVAFDIGTTTLAAYCCDLETGALVHTASMMNPQVPYGDDVMSRISYHLDHPDGLQRMHEDLVAALNRLLASCVSEASAAEPPGLLPPASGMAAVAMATDQIEDLTVVGNTAMHHILLRVAPDALGEVPFAPAIHRGLDLKARDLGLQAHPAAHVYLLPCVAGFVGGDCVGVALAEAPDAGEAIQLIIDIGTNGEILLGNRNRLLCTSCATGPALEGAQIRFGMRAAAGAVERVRINPHTCEVDYKVVGRDAWRSYSEPAEMRVRGICGSGILDVAAEMLLAGIITRQGAFVRGGQWSQRLRTDPATGMAEFVLAWREETALGCDLVITQHDIRQIQLAKAAIHTGCRVLMRKLGSDQVDQVKIAGAFGTHVDPGLALVMGLFPDGPLERVVTIGNAAGDGCRMALLDRGRRTQAERLSRRMEYVALALEPDFQQLLMAAIHLPHQSEPFPHAAALSKRRAG